MVSLLSAAWAVERVGNLWLVLGDHQVIQVCGVPKFPRARRPDVSIKYGSTGHFHQKIGLIIRNFISKSSTLFVERIL